EYEVSSLAFEFSGKDTTLLGHLTPRYGEHSRLNECPVSLDHYIAAAGDHSLDVAFRILVGTGA
ncbi:hypothetical protein, partial [Pseudomonas weihenstephanensis]|uniref:hypothetical protein n=1 Tax=Pseudomonas weihenstephanensis TaxID=1608994 RepID=UPI0019D38115